MDRQTLDAQSADRGMRWRTILWYLPLIAIANLAWELAHLPLYTIWDAEGPEAAAFAALHCTAGDVLLAAVSLALGLVASGAWRWPRRFGRMVVIATLSGIAVTVYLERMQTRVWKGWAYSELMPIVPWLEVGLSPVLQWTVLPPAALLLARRIAARARRG